MKEEVDRHWAELLSPRRRNLLAAAAGVLAGPVALAAPTAGQSPWGYETDKQPTPRPNSVRPGEQSLPAKPRAYTDIESYHAHIYFDEDSHQKASLIRKWVAERFKVELGDWNLAPRGPHVTPSFYFGFTNDLLHIIVPWLQLNSLGLQPVNGYSIKKPGPGEPRVEQIYPNTRPTLPIEKA